ncbi:hypothetical protein BDA99DRAFT_496261 [Phascolomyces articulosus]|uniref:Uncharacterized protein n=1 Tax=Phascolomyces articulosus TaxID=60185 RepID=A0AAD5PKK5_9FUNG|nr:hypothetical protein BDA99DRAFT_496261 [Phascolomyces articulosus]
MIKTLVSSPSITTTKMISSSNHHHNNTKSTFNKQQQELATRIVLRLTAHGMTDHVYCHCQECPFVLWTGYPIMRFVHPDHVQRLCAGLCEASKSGMAISIGDIRCCLGPSSSSSSCTTTSSPPCYDTIVHFTIMIIIVMKIHINNNNNLLL